MKHGGPFHGFLTNHSTANSNLDPSAASLTESPGQEQAALNDSAFAIQRSLILLRNRNSSDNRKHRQLLAAGGPPVHFIKVEVATASSDSDRG